MELRLDDGEGFGSCGCGHDDGKPADAHHDIMQIFEDAAEQALGGKGVERHGVSEWDRQAIHAIPEMLGASGKSFLIGQCMKKAAEAVGMPSNRAYHELLGAAIYLNRAAKLARDGKW